jgi:succinyl-diaminopimelate desuccinylase
MCYAGWLSCSTFSGRRLSNLIADHATADMRMSVGASVAQIETRIAEIIARRIGISLEMMRRYQASWTAPDHAVIQILRRRCSAPNRSATCGRAHPKRYISVA